MYWENAFSIEYDFEGQGRIKRSLKRHKGRLKKSYSFKKVKPTFKSPSPFSWEKFKFDQKCSSDMHFTCFVMTSKCKSTFQYILKSTYWIESTCMISFVLGKLLKNSTDLFKVCSMNQRACIGKYTTWYIYVWEPCYKNMVERIISNYVSLWWGWE